MKTGSITAIFIALLFCACTSSATGFVSSFENTRLGNIPADWFRTTETNAIDSDDISWDSGKAYISSEGLEGKALYIDTNYDPNGEPFYNVKSKIFGVKTGSILNVSYYIKNSVNCPYLAKDWECNGFSLYIFNSKKEHIATYDLFSFNGNFEYDCCANFKTNVESLGNGWYKIEHTLDPLPSDAAYSQLRIIQYNKINQNGYYLIDSVVVS